MAQQNSSFEVIQAQLSALDDPDNDESIPALTARVDQAKLVLTAAEAELAAQTQRRADYVEALKVLKTTKPGTVE